MLNNIKALVVVLFFSFIVFKLGKPIALRFMSEAAFEVRRRVWLALTAFVFLSPSFWLYCFGAVCVLAWARRRDVNDAALYLLVLFVAPNVAFPLPVAGINQLFDLSTHRLLAFVIAIPALVKLKRQAARGEPSAVQLTDWFIYLFCFVQLAVNFPYESITACARRAVLLVLDQVLPYMLFSRVLRSKEQIVEAIATFLLAAAVLALVALFESQRSWLLYVGVGGTWGAANDFAFLMRAGTLRAQASVGHALALGYVMAVAFGFTLFLQKDFPRKTQIGLMLLPWIGLISAYSRGPWFVALFILFAYLFLLPKGLGRTFKALLALGVIGSVIAVTPLGDRIIASLPFIGTVDSENVTYRQQLWDTSVRLIGVHPWFGDLFVLNHMQHLKQGQGIVDLVNGYLQVALFYGLVGLFFKVMSLVLPTLKAFAGSIQVRYRDEQLAALGSVLVACMLGSYMFIAFAGFETLMTLMGGIGIAYSKVVKAQLVVPKRRAVAATAVS